MTKTRRKKIPLRLGHPPTSDPHCYLSRGLPCCFILRYFEVSDGRAGSSYLEMQNLIVYQRHVSRKGSIFWSWSWFVRRWEIEKLNSSSWLLALYAHYFVFKLLMLSLELSLIQSLLSDDEGRCEVLYWPSQHSDIVLGVPVSRRHLGSRSCWLLPVLPQVRPEARPPGQTGGWRGHWRGGLHWLRPGPGHGLLLRGQSLGGHHAGEGSHPGVHAQEHRAVPLHLRHPVQTCPGGGLRGELWEAVFYHIQTKGC